MAWSDAVWPKPFPINPVQHFILVRWNGPVTYAFTAVTLFELYNRSQLVFLHNLEDGGFESEDLGMVSYAIAEHVLDDEHTILFGLSMSC